MERAPITKQRSPWLRVESVQPVAWASVYQRKVGDGALTAIVADEPEIGWHLSISHRDNRGGMSRYPTWDEIAHARDELLPDHIEFVMFLPRSDEYVALHDTTFHLHEHHA